MKPCPSQDHLQRLLNGQLSEKEEMLLEAHVQSCPACLDNLEQLTTASPDTACGLGRDKPAPPRSTPGHGLSGPSEALLSRLISSCVESDSALISSGSGRRVTATTRSRPSVEGYEILGKLGHGGMGVVYKARQLDLQRVVAIKMILAGAHADAQSLARFRAEGEAVARLQHPNIVQIYAVGEADGLPFFALEYVDGGTLAQCVAGMHVAPRRAAELIEILARAVHFAHGHGIVHRDLKPANILLQISDFRLQMTEKGGPFADAPEPAADAIRSEPLNLQSSIPKIADFGLAKKLRNDSVTGAQASITEVGLGVGTPRYMAPEQLGAAEGKPRYPVGPASDIYSLGAILYELLTGRPLYSGNTPLDVMVRVLHEDPLPPHRYRPELPRDLESICLKCLAKNPLERYATARDLAEDLGRFLLMEPVRARPPSLWHRSKMFVRRNKALAGGMAGAAAALLLGILTTSFMALSEASQRRLAEASVRQAEAAERDSQFKAYQARMAAAAAALGDHNIREAAEQLAEAPDTLRGWEWLYMRGRLDDSLEEIHGLGDSLLLCPPGERVAAISAQGIALWDAVGGQRLAIMPCPPPNTLLACTPEGDAILADDGKGSLLLVRSHVQVRQKYFTRSEKYYGRAVALNRSGTRLVAWQNAGPNLGEFTIFELATAKVLLHVSTQALGVRCLAFSPDGGLFVSGGEDRALHLRDTTTGAERMTLHGHLGYVNAVVFSPDGRRLLSCSADQTIRQWEVATGRLLDERHGHVSTVNTIAYSPDGTWFASGGDDATIRIWRASGGPAITVLHGHLAPVRQVAFSRSGDRIASVSADGSARIWDGIERGDARILAGHISFVYPVAYSPDGRWIASGGWDKDIRLWDGATGELAFVYTGHDQYVAALAFTPDSRRLVSRSVDRTVRLWSTDTGAALAVWPDSGIGLADLPHGVAITPDGAFIVSAEGSGLHLRDLTLGTVTREIRVPTQAARLFAFRPDGRQVAVVGLEPIIYLIDVDTGQLLEKLEGHQQIIHSLAWNTEGDRLASAGRDQTVRVWDTHSGECLHVLRGHTDEVFSAAFHPDGTRLASAGRDRVIRIWDVANGAEVARLQGHSDYVFSLQFSPDGSSLVSGSGDYTVRLWDSFPVAQRLRARHQTQAQKANAEKLLNDLFRTGRDRSAVAEYLHTSPPTGEALRRACWHALLRRKAG